MKKLLICIITSERTWKNLSKFNFDIELRKLRNEFDLAVVMNGYASDAIDYYKNFQPEFFSLRPNVGFDTAAIAYFIDLAPKYNHYLLMHDDHWFKNHDWLEKINCLINEDNSVDIWGNILMQEPLPNFKKYCDDVNLRELANCGKIDFLHGMCGLFNYDSISKLKEFKVPYLMSKDKKIAFLGERLFSNILLHLDIKFSQFSDGIFNFFLHGDDNYRNHLFSTANVAYHKFDFTKAKEYYYKYFEYCQKNNYFDDMPVLFNNLANTHFELNEVEEAKCIWKSLLDKIPNFPLSEGIKELINNPQN
ncbi:MAG: hypothetical protein PVH88_25045 [Ignavibacteria bacterium]|jgi:hypothetical protein